MSAIRAFATEDGAAEPYDFARFSAVLATVDAALAAAKGGDEKVLWADALRRLRGSLPWRRAVIVADPPWEISLDTPELRPGDRNDPALHHAALLPGDGRFPLDAGPGIPMGPGAIAALLVRRAPVALYFEFGPREGRPHRLGHCIAERVAGLLVGLGYGAGPLSVEPVGGMIGESPAMAAVFEKIHKHAESAATVYIYGETGTGKEKVAQALHDLSPRRERPFVAVNAAALPDELFESEMFGHLKGAFTGAVADRAGYVMSAEGGTLFLDEVADLSLRAQAKLLRFLEGGEYRRVGEARSRKADVRVVAASNARLDERVSAGTFRLDLLYRLNTLAITLPPLRERDGDVRRIARHLLRQIAESERKPLPRLADSTWRALDAYLWPANVRELRNELHRLVVEHPGRHVRPEDLSPRIVGDAQRYQGRLRDVEAAAARECIRRALEECRGSRPRAARRLGLTRQGLGAKMKRLGIA